MTMAFKIGLAQTGYPVDGDVVAQAQTLLRPLA